MVHVRLLEEGVDVWRPVEAKQVGQSIYRLSNVSAPADETWSFQPGETVVIERRQPSGGADMLLIAVARASDVDERAQGSFALAS